MRADFCSHTPTHMATDGAHLRQRATPAALLLLLLLALQAATTSAAEDAPAQTLLPQPVNVAEDEVTVVGLDEYPDPLEPMNRAIFTFNDVFFTYVAAPLGNAYEILPAGVRSGVSRVFLNLQEPLNLLHNAVQGKFPDAGNNLLRFLSNTVIGLGGVFDPAERWFGIAPAPARFDDTLAHFRVGGGPYLVMPFLGPTNVRGGVAGILDNTFHPVHMITHEPDTTWILVFDRFQRVAPLLDNYVELRNEAEDPYVYFRNQYQQDSARDSRFPVSGVAGDE